MNYPKDLIGLKFDRLTVIERRGLNKYNAPLFLCKCDCGKLKEYSRNKLVTHRTRSCGCLKSDVQKLKNTSHGLCGTRLFGIFKSMKQRCNNPKSRAYKDYGGRGIKIEWKSVKDFHDDMIKSHDEHISIYGIKNTIIERIDVNGNYCKENCKWATVREQNNNKRFKVKKENLIELYGEKKTLLEWARLMKTSKYKLQKAINE